MLDFQAVIKKLYFSLKKVVEIFGAYGESFYLCTRFSTKSGQHNKSFDRLDKTKFNSLKKYFENFSQNIWWIQNLAISLQSVSITNGALQKRIAVVLLK